MNILLVIPVFNEAAQLRDSVCLLDPFMRQFCGSNWEVIVADNGSTDKTFQIALDLERGTPNLRAFHLDQKGRGRALRQVWLDSEADILSYMDVDLSTDLDAFPPLIEALASGDYDLAIGTRLHPESMVRRCWKREMISRGYNRLLRLALHVRFSDAQCGFKALTRRAARQLLPLVEDNEWFFDTELLVMAERYGYRIYEQPVKWTEDPDSRVRLLPTIWGDLKGILRLCRALKRGIHEPLRVERTGLKARLSRCV